MEKELVMILKILKKEKMLKEMFSFAKEFNDNILQRIRLLNAGFMRKINDSIKMNSYG